MDVRTTLANQAYSAVSRSTAAPAPALPQDGDENAAFSEAIRSFSETIRNSEEIAHAALTTGADPHALVTALAQTELAVETAVTVRNKVVEAYQEILRMPV